MEWEEVNRRFMGRGPVRGLSFLLNDSVEVTGGPHSGATGAVVALRSLEPEPTYVVELDSGEDVELRQAELSAIETTSALADLQRWYSAQCGGEWEHAYGIEIGTLDNPGWSVSIDLTDTALADAPFNEVSDSEPERGWIHCCVKNRRFEGHGGPHMLGRIIRTFLQWAVSSPKSAA